MEEERQEGTKGTQTTRTTAWLHKFMSPSRKRARDEKRVLMMDVEITDKCYGGCSYCYASGDSSGSRFIDRERMFGLIDEAREMDLKQVLLIGGEPLLHPHWYDFSLHTMQQGMRSVICSTGEYYTPKVARQIVNDLQVHQNGYVTIHIPTRDEEAFLAIAPGKKGLLPQRIKGLYNLLDAGYPAEKLFCQIVLCQPILPTVEETMDWLVDEIGVSYVVLYPLRLKGYAQQQSALLPTLSQLKRAYEYRAQKLGDEDYLRYGVCELTKFFCHNMIYVEVSGNVLPCDFLPDFAVGNIFQRPLGEIVEGNRDLLTHQFPVKGACATCENNEKYDICRGCRAQAYYYTGDYQAADPTCWWNPEAKERYWE
ncbi:MAG: radical SAM protein [Dehalococcoidia bacterium]